MLSCKPTDTRPTQCEISLARSGVSRGSLVSQRTYISPTAAIIEYLISKVRLLRVCRERYQENINWNLTWTNPGAVYHLLILWLLRPVDFVKIRAPYLLGAGPVKRSNDLRTEVVPKLGRYECL